MVVGVQLSIKRTKLVLHSTFRVVKLFVLLLDKSSVDIRKVLYNCNDLRIFFKEKTYLMTYLVPMPSPFSIWIS